MSDDEYMKCTCKDREAKLEAFRTNPGLHCLGCNRNGYHTKAMVELWESVRPLLKKQARLKAEVWAAHLHLARLILTPAP
jgi:hypothetical protein